MTLQIKSADDLAAAIWVHVVSSPEDILSLSEAETNILAGTMTLEAALAHEHADILTEDV